MVGLINEKLVNILSYVDVCANLSDKHNVMHDDYLSLDEIVLYIIIHTIKIHWM